ncbi:MULTISPECIES: rhodanese-like domain-containing protein [Halorussus]|uniref:rhodanese-like domain-containing protein n=1 Tax=Halorussus TaxID=1070314 RepID=UPI000E2142D7|nr:MULTISPECIES: rhodanese-like domain-containing protein [Halorussus]NHN57816.1 rhodanese-like domain-containing protein [Halorussus sp. JP-T4]
MTELDRTAWGMAEAADEAVESVTVEELRAELDEAGESRDGETVVVDVRDIREVWIEGSIPDAQHAPRGMIEFWADPETKYHKEFFDPEKRYVLFCNEAGRSALAARRLGEMGYSDVAHLEGGFTAWQEAGGEVADVPQKDYKGDR